MKYSSEEERLADLGRLDKTDWSDPKAVASLFAECAQEMQEQRREEQESPAGNLVEPPKSVH